MASRSVVLEARDINLAIELIELGARLQVLEAEVGLSRERLIKLYKEVRGVSPPKGMLPFSTDWFMTWQPNIHSSLFFNAYRFMIDHARCTPIQATIRAYRVYLEHVGLQGGEAVLGLTRAWTLLRFFDSGMLQSAPCSRCSGHFVTHAPASRHGIVCGLCQPPSRAGKTRVGKAAGAAETAADRFVEQIHEQANAANFAPVDATEVAIAAARSADTAAASALSVESMPEATLEITFARSMMTFGRRADAASPTDAANQVVSDVALVAAAEAHNATRAAAHAADFTKFARPV